MKNNPYSLTKDDIEFIFKMCAMSPYVKKNPDYNKKTIATKIVVEEDDTINANARSLSATSHLITILTGLCNAYSLLGTALASFKNDTDVTRMINACNWIGERCEKNSYVFTDTDIIDGIQELGYDLNDSLYHESKGFITGLTLSVIAHELGHISLSHTVNNSDNYEVSRNDERQADLFAQSVISTTPFAGYLVLSSLFTYVLFSWMDKNYDGDATTHPYSKERVMNTLNSHEKYLEGLGITKDNINEFLP